jgi:hypothetical protein
MRHILRFILFAILLGLATSANAQECSTANQPPKTWNQQPSDPLCGSGPGQTYFGDPTFIVYSTTVDTCTDNNTGAVYAQSARQVTGSGAWHCYGGSLRSNLKCNPRIEQQLTHATSGADFNRFYLRAWDINPGYVYQCTEFPAIARQDFWQCSGRNCRTIGPTCSPGCYPISK